MDFSLPRSVSLPENMKIGRKPLPPSYNGIYMEYGADQLHKEIHYFLKKLKKEYTEEEDVIAELEYFLEFANEYLEDVPKNNDIGDKDRKRIIKKMMGDKLKIEKILRL
jgi:hypothetical protein